MLFVCMKVSGVAVYKDFFNDKSANLAAQDYIPAATGSWISREIVGIDVGMTNFRAFLETGEMKFSGPEGEVTIDFAKDDALTRAIKDVAEDALKQVQFSDEYRDLMEADPPSLEQRLAYEQVLSKAVFEGVEGIDGLNKYRLDQASAEASDMPESMAYSKNEITSNNNLNSLSIDINGKADENVSYTTDFECEKMSALKGLIMQGVEDALLPPDDNTLGSAGSYFNAQGGIYHIGGISVPKMEQLVGEDEAVKVKHGWHAFITSSKSGAVFEATAVVEEDTIGQNFYGDDRMLIPLSFDGHLPEQAPYNYNFAMLAAGGRVSYVPMDPNNPGNMHPEADLGDISAYQVGSNDQLFAERMMAIQSGHLEGLSDLQKTIPQMSVDLMRNDLKYAAADFFNRSMIEEIAVVLHSYDPDGQGALTFLDNMMRRKVEGFEGLPESLRTAYTDYTAKGLDVPSDLLLKIANDVDAGEFYFGNIKVQGALEALKELREDGASDMEKQLIGAGMTPEEAKVFADDFSYSLGRDEFRELEGVGKISAQMVAIVNSANELENEISSDIKNASITLSGDQNNQDTQEGQPRTNTPLQPQESLSV